MTVATRNLEFRGFAMECRLSEVEYSFDFGHLNVGTRFLD